jgi:hypothetical protein
MERHSSTTAIRERRPGNAIQETEGARRQMPTTPQNTTPILDDAEAARRLLLLAQLKTALADLGFQCTLARKHHLVLRYADGVAGPNGLTDPQLYVFTEPAPAKVTTDGVVYQVSDSQKFPAANPTAAAAVISRALDPDACARTITDPAIPANPWPPLP